MGGTLKEDLKREIAAGRCVAIVGAGVSIFSTRNAQCASWTGLLRHGVQRCTEVVADLPDGWAGRVTDDIRSGDPDDLLSAAEKVARKLRAPDGGEYARWLRESVGTLKAERLEVLDVLADLGVTLATTNYDDLIESATGLPPITWMDGTRVERVFRGDDRAVVHLHGYWQRPESVILGIRSYDQVLGNEQAQAMLRAIAAIRTILFVGCGDGLADPNFGTLLNWTGNVFARSEYRRFLLARSGEVRKRQQEHPPERKIFVLDYGQDFDDLAPFLGTLRSAAESPVSTTAVAITLTAGSYALPPKPRCVGRNDEIADLVAALTKAELEPVPILGPPGIGKTNLALAAAHRDTVVSHYGARRTFLRCDGLRSRADLAAALANALAIPLCKDKESAVLGELSRAPALLVLDNAETPWEADTLGVEELFGRMASVAGLALVVTIQGNQRPAGVAWRDPIRLKPLSPNAARELFLYVAGRHFGSDPRLDDLLSAVDHVPLAITLIAARAEGEPDLENLWQQWQKDRSAMLSRAGGSDSLTNMELLYELAWAGPRMTPDGRRLLQLLALMPAGVAHLDLEAVLPDADRGAPAVRKAGLAFDEASRLRVLAPLREYVRRRYPPASEDEARLLSHFFGLAEEQGARVGHAEGAMAIVRLGAEVPNIEVLLHLGLRGEATAVAIRAARCWARFMLFTGVGSTAPLERAVKVARDLDDPAAAADCIESLADLARMRSDHEGARARYEEARLLYQQLGDRLGEANCIKGLGDLARSRSDLEGARARFEEARPLYGQLDNMLGEANCIYSMGHLALDSSDLQEARARFEEARPLYKQVGALLGEANCVCSLGDLALNCSNLEEARARYEEARPLYQQLGTLLGEANCIYSLGYLALNRSDLEEAQRRYEEARRLYRQLGDLLGEANCIYGLADLALRRSDLEGARARCEEARLLYRQVGDLLGEGNCHFATARSWMLQGLRSEAIAGFGEARLCYERFGDPYPIGASRYYLALLSEGAAREAHRQAAREAWLGLPPEALAGWAASDGIDPRELESP